MSLPPTGPKTVEQELAETLRTVRGLRAQSPDEIEDYFHDSIVNLLGKGRRIDGWLGYLYKSVKQRLRFGKEVRPNLPLTEAIVPSVPTVSLDTMLDIEKALGVLSERERAFIMDYFYEGYTLVEMEVRHQVTNQYISKVIRQALANMREVFIADSRAANSG
jgi:DNA-directed RNA polymerase specialized sigma24 family protein